MVQGQTRTHMRLLLAAALAACVWLGGAGSAFNVLLIGGTRFSGAYLWSELFRRGHSVTLYNRGKTSPKRLPRESEAEFAQRLLETKMITGDRKDAAVLKALIDPKEYDYVFDMNGRERSDTEPLVEIFRLWPVWATPQAAGVHVLCWRVSQGRRDAALGAAGCRPHLPAQGQAGH
jgi:hypothetical protein